LVVFFVTFSCFLLFYVFAIVEGFGWKMILSRMSMRELNEKLSIISRVVAHPQYRTIGLGHRLIREALEHAGMPYVETVAGMVEYHPFFEKAGMRKIAESQPVKEALKITEVLNKLGFDVTYLRSPKYVTKKTCKPKRPRAEDAQDSFLRKQASTVHEGIQLPRALRQKQILQQSS
jgi:GNAT superfamily N-acetyltransferase